MLSSSVPRPLPVLGPGAMPGDGPECLSFPEEMATFRAPRLAAGAGSGVAEARAALAGLQGALRAWRFGAPGAPVLDLAALSGPGREALDGLLGDGEVSAVALARGPEEPAVRARETAFAGLWRVQVIRPGGALAQDLLEVGDFPAAIRALAGGRRPVTPPLPGPGLMNGLALANELAAAARAHAEAAPGAAPPAHVVNLTQLPVSPEDHAYLAAAVGTGNVAILSRGYGSCRITSTAAGNVWWVRYHNAMGQLILDTLEVSDVPEVARAAREDLEDTAERLAEWIAALDEEAA